jgi:SAM-dependent methyltransferase
MVAIKMYSELAAWWPLLSPPEEYLDEFRFFERVLGEEGLPEVPTMIELGCGGGNNALHLKGLFSGVTLTDVSPQMLEVSRALNPECEHLVGDMRTLRLSREFDVVFVHDAIDYMTSLGDLRLALETAFVHCKPGGLALLVPDYVRETFEASTDHGGSDSEGGERGLRYLEWTYDPEDGDSTYTTEYAYMLREGNQPAWVEYDRHVCGLFLREEWMGLLGEVGFGARIEHDEFGRDVFVARRVRVE